MCWLRLFPSLVTLPPLRSASPCRVHHIINHRDVVLPIKLSSNGFLPIAVSWGQIREYRLVVCPACRLPDAEEATPCYLFGVVRASKRSLPQPSQAFYDDYLVKVISSPSFLATLHRHTAFRSRDSGRFSRIESTDISRARLGYRRGRRRLFASGSGVLQSKRAKIPVRDRIGVVGAQSAVSY